MKTNRCHYRELAFAALACAMFALIGAHPRSAAAASPPDREDDVFAVRLDVYVVTAFGMLTNPVGFCTTEPCAAGETSPSAELYTSSGSPLGLTWGEFQAGSASSRVSCLDGGAATEIRMRLTGLVPTSVYSVFYRTFGPDSANPFCPNEERSVVVPNGFQSSVCPGLPDSRIVTNAKGAAKFDGIVDGCLLDATTVLLDVIYHSVETGRLWKPESRRTQG